MQEKNFIKSALQVIQIEGNAILALQDQLVNGVNLGLTFRNQFQALATEYENDIDEIIAHWTSDANLES